MVPAASPRHSIDKCQQHHINFLSISSQQHFESWVHSSRRAGYTSAIDHGTNFTTATNNMGRLAWYAGVSTALAGGVVVSAFNQRANFYSACVYLSQSNLCLMILINLILLIYTSFMYGLQRLCYGPLRPIEIEQLYEKAWFAVTETCLAMTIFREEVGAWFLVMFVALLTGKVWGWIGDGRVEVLEQQPPANPRLFHIRLSVSLTMSILYDLWLMNYTINAVIQQARPTMMVMFLFEFAILTTCSFATGIRYCISLIEARLVKKQTQERLLERRREVREERAEILRQREAAVAEAEAAGTVVPTSTDPLPSEDDVDEMDIEVPGWESKGQWVLTLDLISDFIKLGIYVTFFVILFMFYGLPIHIIRDLFMTARSFTKRLAAFLRYRRATQDMNTKYEDATVEDIQREDTCIICREEMRPWSVTNPQEPAAAPGAAAAPAARAPSTLNERSRPKKLPCGHILHLGCLKSWLERQQVCPTCRASVVDAPQAQATRGAANNANGAAQGAQPQVPGQQDGPGAPPPPAGNRPVRGMRMINFGPLRVGFGQANLQDLAQGVGAQQPNQDNGVAGGPRVYGLELGFPRRVQPQPQAQDGANPISTSTNLQESLQHIEQQIVAEIRSLQVTQQELQLVQLLQVELGRLRQLQNAGSEMPIPPVVPFGTRVALFPVTVPQSSQQPHMQRHGARANTAAIPSGSSDLPPGVTIPEGWTLLPLQRLDGPVVSNTMQTTQVPLAGPAGNPTTAPTATTQPDTISPMSGASNNNQTPTINPENNSQASQNDSSNSNAISTSPSASVDQSTTSNVASSTTPTRTISTTLNNNPASIASTDATPNPSVLPNWGSSQLFSGPTLTSGNTSGSSSSGTTMPPPPSQGSHVDNNVNANAHVAPSTTTPSSPHNTDDSASSEAHASREEKGKGKATAQATVEDTVDEDLAGGEGSS
ncbi:RING/U-box [Glarea lozoyensis ATCC 20868]|uniref:RING-type E3 ubiquitin transferase n=1 Tax=Glarea lozoyensis (strain ATCC 20868 / MF5171) TaxID=1116229 RepID=S3DW36_GLAL2|nr:RING/U-box [Glarea lozoyensis ATCC 20868]EPE36166.1 RING/U-box [Glarea lozoyensis ATCC 20868]